MEIASDAERHPVIALNVDELLALPRNDEVKENVLVGVAHHRRLGPTVRSYGRDGHEPVAVQDVDCLFLHGRSSFERFGSGASQSCPSSFIWLRSEMRKAVDQPSMMIPVAPSMAPSIRH